jgi:hypothetical protein
MDAVELSAGSAAVIGPYTLEVLEVHPDRVVFALHGPEDGDEGGDSSGPVESGTEERIEGPSPHAGDRSFLPRSPRTPKKRGRGERRGWTTASPS